MLSKVTAVIQNKYFLSLSGNVIMSGVGMLTMALIYRSLPITDVGIWTLFTSTLLLIDTFRSGLLTTAFIKFYAGATPERAAEVTGSAWFIGIAITFILALISLPILFFPKELHDPGYALFFRWFAICFVFMLPWFIATCVLQGEQRFDRMLYVRFANQGSFIIFITILIITHRISLMTVLYAYLTSNLITSIYTLIMGWSRISTFKHRSKAGIKEIFDFGKYSVGTALSSNLFGYTDTYIIYTFLGGAALAIYNLGQTLMQVVEILLRSFAATAMPSLSAAYNRDGRDSVIYIMKQYIGMITFMLVPIAIFGWLLADIPILIVAGHRFNHQQAEQAANVFRLFLTFALLYPADRFFALTLDVIHQPKVNFYKVLVMLAANITFDIIGVKVLGNIYGIAVTTVMPVLVGVIISFWALNKYQKFSFWNIYVVGWAETKVLLVNTWQKVRPNKG